MNNIFDKAIKIQGERRKAIKAALEECEQKIQEATAPYTVGTSCFQFEFHAEQYYAQQGIGKEGVAEKIKAGEILIGFPPHHPDATKVEKDKSGRFMVTYDVGRSLANESNTHFHQLMNGFRYERLLQRVKNVKETKFHDSVTTKSRLKNVLLEAISSKWPKNLPYNGYGPYCSPSEIADEEGKRENNRVTSFDFNGDRYDIGTIRICFSSNIGTHYGMMGRTASVLFKNGEFLSVVKNATHCQRLVLENADKDIVPFCYI